MVFPHISYVKVVVNQSNTNPIQNNNEGTSAAGNNFDSIPMDSNNHPLFLHNNDHPGLVLITKKLIGRENFGP